jgi:hypothetical protein
VATVLFYLTLAEQKSVMEKSAVLRIAHFIK